MSAVQFFLPFDIAIRPTNTGVPGALLYVYAPGTTTLRPVYATSALTSQLSNPVEADGAGRFPSIYLDNALTYKIVITDKAGAQLYSRDPYIPGEAPDSASLAPYQAAAEAAAAAAGSSASDAAESEAVASAAATVASGAATSASASAGAAVTSAAAAIAAEAGAEAAEAGVITALAGTSLTSIVVPVANRTLLAALATTYPAYLFEAGREGNFVHFTSAQYNTATGRTLATDITADPNQGIFVPTGTGAWVRKFGNRIKAKWFGIDLLGIVDDGAKVLSIYTLAFALCATGSLYYASFASPSVEFPFMPNGINMGSTTVPLTKAIATYGEAGSDAGASATWFKWTGDCNGFEVRAPNCHFDGIAGKGTWTTASPAEGEYHFIKAYYRFSFGRLYGDSWRGDVIHVNVSAGSGGDTEGNANAVRGQWLGAFRSRRAISMEGADANAGLIDFIDANDCRHAGVYEASFLGNAYGAFQGAGNGVTGYGTPTCTFNNGHIFYVISGQETGAATNSPPATATSNTWWGYWKDAGAATAYAPQWVSGASSYRAGGAFIVPLTKVSNCSTLDYIYTEVDQPPVQTAQNTLIKGGLNGAGYSAPSRYITANTNGVVVGPGLRVMGPLYQLNSSSNPLTLSGVESGLDSYMVMKTGNVSSNILFQNNVGVTQASLLASNTFGLFLDAIAGLNFRFNGSTKAQITTTGFQLIAGSLGYGTGAGGSQTQLTNKSTAVTLNTATGQITMNNASLAAGAIASFTFNNSQIGVNDQLSVWVKSGNASVGSYRVASEGNASGSRSIVVENKTGGALAEALVIGFTVIDGAIT